MATQSKRARKRKQRKVRSRHVGAPPGELHVLEDAGETDVRVFRYDESQLSESSGLPALKESGRGVVWVDVVGLGSIDVVRAVGEHFGLHALALEDVVHPHQRPKVEDYPETLFIVTRSARERDQVLDVEQISMFVGKDFVVTFQEREGDAYGPVRARLREAKGRIRQKGASYLAYALLDATVDAMFPLLELYDQRLEALEERVFRTGGGEPVSPEEIHDLGRDLMAVRRTVLPLREALSRLMREDHPLIDDELRLYLRDCQDHLSQMVDLLEGQRELAKGISEGHLSNLGQRSNDVMKVLTIIATIFIPLSFIAGLYGMNFDHGISPYNMPELRWRYGYPAALLGMASVALGMLAFFRRKKWF